mmetsp:Transcript_6333/g.16336  ORF Transcript_6333/g.16336 Transcript_6333/m.16336 type:complete len:201 (+) Transcript_6333:290-892(+)
MGSPRAVPVPCMTIWLTCSGVSLASLIALDTSSDWEGPCGAVRLLDLPSWFTKEATTLTELEEFPSSWLCIVAAVSIKAMMASARPYPSAEASSVLHLPSPDRAWRLHTAAVVCGKIMTFVPATFAAVHSCAMIAFLPRCVAARDEEHAVSMLMHGPLKPNTYDTRPTRKLNPLPVPAFALLPIWAFCSKLGYSVYMHPT